MARSFLTPINLNKLELQDAVIQNKTATTINGMTPVAGQLYYDSTNNVLRVATGTTTSDWYTIATNRTTGSYTSAITIGGTSINIGATASSLSNVSISGSGTWTATNIAVLNGGTGTSTGSITGTGALTFTAGGSNTNVTLVPNGTGSVDVSSKTIINVATPINDNDAANKKYVDDMAAGVNAHDAVKYATTAALGTNSSFPTGNKNLVGGTITTTYNNGAGTLTIATSAPWSDITVDGQTVTVGDRILIKDQASALQNGIYTVTSVGAVSNSTSFVFTRAADSNSTPELGVGDLTYIINGTNLGTTSWVQIATVTTIGTDPITWAQFSGASTTTAGAGLVKNGNAFDIGAGNGITVATDAVSVNGGHLWIGSSNVVVATSAPTSQAITGISSIAGPTGGTFTVGNATRATSGNGYVTTITGINANTSGSGGNVFITGGSAAGTNTNGGTLYLDGGVPQGTGSSTVNIGSLSTILSIGAFGTTTTTINGTVKLADISSAAGTAFVKWDSTAKTLSYDSTSYANLGAANSFVYAGTQTFRYSTNSDAIIIAPRNGGSGPYGLSLTTETLTGNDTLVLPDTGGNTQQIARVVTGTATLTAQNTITATHNLQKRLVHAQLFDGSYNLVETDVVLTSTTVTTFTFAANQNATFYWVITG